MNAMFALAAEFSSDEVISFFSSCMTLLVRLRRFGSMRPVPGEYYARSAPS